MMVKYKQNNNDSEFIELCTLLKISVSGFVLCTYDKEDTYDSIYKRLKNILLQKNLKLQEIGSCIQFLDLEKFLLESNNEQNIVFSVKWDEEILKEAIVNYNVRRDFYNQQYKNKMIIWIPQNSLKFLLNQIPDFWRTKLGTYKFQNENNQTNQVVIDLKEDDNIITNLNEWNRISVNIKTWKQMVPEQQDLIKGFVILMKHYYKMHMWNESKQCLIEIKNLENRIFSENERNSREVTEKISDLACRFIKIGIIQIGLKLYSIVLERCREQSGSSRDVKRKYDQLMKRFHVNMGDAFMEANNFSMAEQMYEKVLKNLNSIWDRKMKNHINMKLKQLIKK